MVRTQTHELTIAHAEIKSLKSKLEARKARQKNFAASFNFQKQTMINENSALATKN